MSIRATTQKPRLQVTDFCVSVGHESEQRYVLSLNITAVNEQQRRMALDFVRHGVEYAVNGEEQSTLTCSHDDNHQRTTTLVLLVLFY